MELDLVALFDGVVVPGGVIPTTKFHRGDSNADGVMNITDGIFVLNFLFLGGPGPAAPGPPDSPCGPDPASSVIDLGCTTYNPCAG